MPFTPLRPIADDELWWIVRFYRPIHSDGCRKRLNRLEAQARFTKAIAKSLAERVHLSKHEAVVVRSEEMKEKLICGAELLADCLKLPDECDSDECGRIARMFLLKRRLLNVIWFLHCHDPELTKPRWNAMEMAEDLIEDDTNDWMEILDYVQTMKNPNYLNSK